MIYARHPKIKRLRIKMDNGKIQVAILTGGHPYDVMSFNKLLGSLPGVEYNFQAIDEFCTDPGKCADKYDVIL